VDADGDDRHQAVAPAVENALWQALCLAARNFKGSVVEALVASGIQSGSWRYRIDLDVFLGRGFSGIARRRLEGDRAGENPAQVRNADEEH
jgi:hypothetical protein